MSPSKLTPEVWPITDAGQVQEENADYVLVRQPTDPNEALYSGSMYVVTDGIGSGSRAQIASRYAAEKIMHTYYNRREPDLGLRLREAVEAANTDLYEYARQQPELVKIGATVVAVVIRGEQLHIAAVGDSRAYRIRDGEIEQLTRDHTLVQQLLDEEAISPDEARDHPRSDVVLRMLGAEETVTVDIFDLRLRPDDALVLCTDGLTQHLHPDEISTIVSSTSPRSAAEMMVQKVNDRGGKDNVTIIAALVRDGAPPLETDIPHTWRGQAPFFDDPHQTLLRRRPDAPAEPEIPPTIEVEPPSEWLEHTVRARRTGPEGPEPVGTSLPPERAPTEQGTGPAPAGPPEETTPAPPPQPRVEPAPPYQMPVQPAPPYGTQPPPQAPPPQQQQPPPPAYQQPPPPQQQYGQRGAPRGYQPPPGYSIDPVTGLPPTPAAGQPSEWGAQAQAPGGPYAPRIYQPPAQPNVRPRRRGISLGAFALIGLVAVLLTVVMVVVLVNPMDWTLPFTGGGEETAAAGEGGDEEAAQPTTEQPAEQPVTPAGEATAAPTLTPVPVAPPGMVEVPGGPFMRGVSDAEIDSFVLLCIDESTDEGDPRCRRDYFIDAQPVAEVTLSPFFIDVTEVTNLNYANCVAAEVCTPPGNQEFYADTAFAQHPVVYVTWDQATQYCQWAGKRLPTEAEWEKAARWDEAAQKSYVFTWGDTWEAGKANTASAALGGTSAVQAFAQDISPYGVLGMIGNVSEWVQDWYFPDYAGLGQLNPARLGNQPLPTPERAVRGGSFLEDLTAYVRAGHRLSAEFDKSASWLGFRCASDVGEAPAELPTEAPAEGTPAETPAETPTGTTTGEAPAEATETPGSDQTTPIP
jgi:serine/threonine protein phosphatase PrpC/formylglycine-generating enzyme required for sulfatase activity